MKSSFFYSGKNISIQESLKSYLNKLPDFMSLQTARSPRAVGDAIQDVVAEKLGDLLGDECNGYSSVFARRAMADAAFTFSDGDYCIVDVKTHRKDTAFNMPNLTSVERISRFYEDDKNIFSILMVSYQVEGSAVRVSDVKFCPIEFIDWGCLTIGALGWGQIQIANANRLVINQNYSRKDWMLKLCDVMLEFYPREILRINERVSRFADIKEFWECKENIWK
ncbi:MAG: hypothetical protein AUJ12_01430 [Alphaproteobacteria bacterium CG1_02_46_17]|nr:MAG: hypothetical protein AUJ12_01430 [Alphaproteobacteria bacterium CG1_02_46_17]